MTNQGDLAAASEGDIVARADYYASMDHPLLHLESSQAMSSAWRTAKAEIERLRAEVAVLREALQKISKAKPDQLDHSIDVAIIQRAARIASAAIGRK